MPILKGGISAESYFESQYVLRQSLPTFMDHVEEWEALSCEEYFADTWHCVEKYGDHERQSFELFKVREGQEAKGLAIFIHGGFWRAMDREQSRFVARPFLDNGYDCVIAEYRLLPEFRLGDLVDDTAQMLATLVNLRTKYSLSSNILLAGHSAGAHLAVHGLKQAVAHGFSPDACSLLLFSGVFDIYPISKTTLGDELQMPAEDIARWSIYESDTVSGIEPLFLVGDDETDDFKRQSIIGSHMLSRRGNQNIHFIPGVNHLTLMTKFATDKNMARDTLTTLLAGDDIPSPK